MRKILFTVFALFICHNSSSQIEMDEPEENVVTPIPYNGEFMKLPYIIEDETGLGLIGSEVTLIDVSSYSIENIDGTSVNYNEKDKFNNKTFTVTNYEKDLYPILTIENATGKFKWEVSSTHKYVFNKFISNIKDRLEGKFFTPLHSTTEIEGLDGSKVVIDSSLDSKITKVSYAKFSIIEYGIKVEINNEFSIKYLTGDYDQPTYHNGNKNVPNIGWINLSNNYVEVTFLASELFKDFKIKNNKFINEIRDRIVKVGMSEQQCRWAWGIPSSSYGSLAGYDEVYDWGGKSLYFKNNKLALIK